MLSGEVISKRLAVILAADLAGYSRRKEADQEGTLALQSPRRDLIDPKIALDKGHAVKTAGHGMLVEFARAVETAPIAAG
jgi:adenylate cyclase